MNNPTSSATIVLALKEKIDREVAEKLVERARSQCAYDKAIDAFWAPIIKELVEVAKAFPDKIRVFTRMTDPTNKGEFGLYIGRNGGVNMLRCEGIRRLTLERRVSSCGTVESVSLESPYSVFGSAKNITELLPKVLETIANQL